MIADMQPLVSVVTVTLNCENTIGRTIDSVNQQTYKNIEHVIKDGISEDSTIEIIKSKASDNISYFACADCGIYDAFNQAIKKCNGKYIIFLHADDIFKDNTVISSFIKDLEKTRADGMYGNIEFVSKQGLLRRKWRSSPFKLWKLYLGWMPPHTSLILKRSVYNEIGDFDTDYKVAGDYDHIVRLFMSGNYNINYKNMTLSVMALGGASTSGLSSEMVKIKEDWRVVKKYGLYGLITLIMKRFIKINQWIFK